MASAAAGKRGAAVKIVRTLRDAGHEAYLAGGCVRDRLLGIEPKDYDVATSARPEQVRRLLPRSRFVGEAFGVVLVSTPAGPIEVATFRLEWGYADGRRPDRVEFTDARHDAQRRDFTINGLFEDPWTGVVDYVGGVKDLRAKTIRAIGNPEDRFAEDHLRMLRAARFAARLGFTIERKTAAAIRAHADQLRAISRERIGQEVQAMLSAGPTRHRAATLIQRLGLDAPTLNEPHVNRRLTILGRLAPQASYPAALSAWLLDRHLPREFRFRVSGSRFRVSGSRFQGSGSRVQGSGFGFINQVVRRWRSALCLSNDHRDALAGALALLPAILDWDDLDTARRKRTLAHPCWPDAWAIACALRPLQTRRIENQVRELLAQGVAPTPLVDGHDLIRLGVKPGPAFGRILEQAYDAQLHGELTTRQQALDWLGKHAPRD